MEVSSGPDVGDFVAEGASRNPKLQWRSTGIRGRLAPNFDGAPPKEVNQGGLLPGFAGTKTEDSPREDRTPRLPVDCAAPSVLSVESVSSLSAVTVGVCKGSVRAVTAQGLLRTQPKEPPNRLSPLFSEGQLLAWLQRILIKPCTISRLRESLKVLKTLCDLGESL